jgi:hypothetical protein
MTGGHGAEGFRAALEKSGAEPAVENGLVTFTVIPPAGARAGSKVRTGVTVAELASWPMIPPHWVHLPADVQFPRTNTQASPSPGWSAHSRDTAPGWGRTGYHAAEWLAHIRGILGEATA